MLRLILIGIVAIVLIGVAAIVVAHVVFDRQIAGDVAALRTQAKRGAGSVVTESTLAALPAPAQRYFRYAGIVGRPIPSVVTLTQSGRIRSSADAAWMSFEAEETYSVSPPGFVWRAWFPSRATPMVMGRDEYLGGSGSIEMKMLGLVPVADEHGDEMRAAGLMRFLNEATWFPAALLGPNVTISAIDDSSFGVTMQDRGLTAQAVIFVDAEGRMTNFRARRFNTGSRSTETWETPITDYADFNSMQLPKVGSAIWKLPSGDLDYIELTVTSVTYE